MEGEEEGGGEQTRPGGETEAWAGCGQWQWAVAMGQGESWPDSPPVVGGREGEGDVLLMMGHRD